MKLSTVAILTVFLLIPSLVFSSEMTQMRIETYDVTDRAAIANLGVSIDYVHPVDGWITVTVPEHRLHDIDRLGYAYELMDTKNTFPAGYENYHDFTEQVEVIQNLNATYPGISSLFTIGQSYEGKDLWCLKISDNPDEDETSEGAIFIVALHHAREILSPEVALHIATQLLELYGVDEMITSFVDNREIYIVPNINPDGGEYDHSGTNFKLWRKNRRENDGWPDVCKGVDLNRNYGYMWGGAGSTNFPCDLTYRGTEAFSEPESQAVRDFVTEHSNINVLISLHTFSELVLYPWGYKSQSIENLPELYTFRQLAKYFVEQNGYTDQQAAQLYPTTGDTTDWAYGELGIYAFTFELSPTSQFQGGFYPDADIIPQTIVDNFNAVLIGIGMSREPELVLSTDLWKLNAKLSGTDVTINWAPIVETQPEGWNILRADLDDGNYEIINTEVIQPGLAQYSYVDAGLEIGKAYNYFVEYLSAVDNDQRFGPLTVKISDPNENTDDDDDASPEENDDDSGDDDDDDDSACCG